MCWLAPRDENNKMMRHQALPFPAAALSHGDSLEFTWLTGRLLPQTPRVASAPDSTEQTSTLGSNICSVLMPEHSYMTSVEPCGVDSRVIFELVSFWPWHTFYILLFVVLKTYLHFCLYNISFLFAWYLSSELDNEMRLFFFLLVESFLPVTLAIKSSLESCQFGAKQILVRFAFTWTSFYLTEFDKLSWKD